jgi:hypothetical protein
MMRARESEGLQPMNGQQNLAQQAKQIDQRIRAAVKTLRKSCTELGALLARMKDRHLWQYLPGKKFRSFEEYATAAMGQAISRSRGYELVTAYMLTTGENPIPAQEVEQMGIKRAVEVARLRPKQRTPEIREMAKTEPVMVVRNKVQAILNADLPKDEQKPTLKLLAINLPEEYVTDFEELIELLGHTDGARDGDSTQAIRAKAFKLMLIGASEYWAQELAAVMREMKAEAATHDSPAAEAQADFPDSDEEGNVFPDDEQAHTREAKGSHLRSGPERFCIRDVT